MKPPLTLTDLDRRIWDEELDEFVPERVFDVHTHLYRWEHFRDPEKESGPYRALLGEAWAEATAALADECDRILMPGRQVNRLAFPFPFPHHCDFDAANEFLAQEVSTDPRSAGLMLVHPDLEAEKVEADVLRYGFLGLKPYRFYSRTGDAVECAITDFMPEEQLGVADRYGLIVMLHLARRDAIADLENQREMAHLCERYPKVRWILAHCARGYSAWAIDRAADTLRALPNVWFDTSSVCETDAIAALYRAVRPERVMYGSDDIPIGVLRGKYVAFGYAWAYLSETNHQLSLSHCDGRMTFTRYEQLRAMRRAAECAGLDAAQRRALFHDNAANLISSVRADLTRVRRTPLSQSTL
ncbi:MAG: amidohydrolase family protein [Actinomycetota bacterium]